MKVCYLNHDLSDKTGAGRFCLALLNAFKEAAPDLDFKVLTHDDILPRSVFGLLWEYIQIRNVLKGYDIIHALDGWPYGFIAVLCSLGLGKKIVITAIGTGAVQPLYRPFKKRLMIWAYKRADKVVAVSSNTKREILKIIPGLDISVINHGVDCQKFKIQNFFLREISRRETKFKIIEGLRPYILSVGALKKRKGFEYSIKAFAQVASKFQGLKYVIVGQGVEGKTLKSWVMGHGLQDRIIFFDQVDEDFLIDLYKNAELFILLPQDIGKDIEGFGLVFLEAAACGLPVIGSSGSGADDAIDNNSNGFLLDSEDSVNIAGFVSRILSEEGFRKKLSQNSIIWARGMNWDKVAQLYVRVYDSLI